MTAGRLAATMTGFVAGIKNLKRQAVMVYLWATLLFLVNLLVWTANLFSLPGNWLILLVSALYAWLLPEDLAPRLSWTAVGIAAGLALLGELVEFVAGAAGAAKAGGSRRAMVLALVAAIVGSIVGAVFAVPIPVIGPLVGALGGGGLGAFLGAYAGETWKGKSAPEAMATSRAALIGRLLGTLGKAAAGAAMIAVITVDAFV